MIAALVFMFRMADAVEVSSGVRHMQDEDGDDDMPGTGPGHAEADQRAYLPKGVEVYRISGPLFFGAANRLDNLLDQFSVPPKAFILRMRLVPIIDASGVHALQKLADRCKRKGIALIVSGLQEQPNRVLAQMQTHDHPSDLHLAPDFEHALSLAKRLTQQGPSAPAQ
jgi:SulP family sulfate permease